MKYSSIPATSTVFYVTKSQVIGISVVCESDEICHRTQIGHTKKFFVMKRSWLDGSKSSQESS